MNPLNTQTRTDYDLFSDLDAEELALFAECAGKILHHADRNIAKAHWPADAARFLSFKWVLSKSIQKADN